MRADEAGEELGLSLEALQQVPWPTDTSSIEAQSHLQPWGSPNGRSCIAVPTPIKAPASIDAQSSNEARSSISARRPIESSCGTEGDLASVRAALGRAVAASWAEMAQAEDEGLEFGITYRQLARVPWPTSEPTSPGFQTQRRGRRGRPGR